MVGHYLILYCLFLEILHNFNVLGDELEPEKTRLPELATGHHLMILDL